MRTIRLKLREEVMKGDAIPPIEVDSLTPDKIAGKNKEEIEAVKVWWGNRQENTGDLFDVSIVTEEFLLLREVEKPSEVKIIFEGDLSRVKHIGDGMKGGEIEALGNVDMHCGAMMEGGRVTVKGNADCWAGREMRGGELVIEGDAADNLCAMYRGEMTGMTGGKVTVEGNAGECVGQYMTGGEILIKGNADVLAGYAMRGGRIVIEGDAAIPGADMIKGEIIVKGDVEMLPSFKYVGVETIEGEEYDKYMGDYAMGEKKAKGTLYVKKK